MKEVENNWTCSTLGGVGFMRVILLRKFSREAIY
jgi:hypothetical protein